MILTNLKYSILTFTALISGLLLGACTDDDLIPGDDSPEFIIPEDGYGLSFTIKLDSRSRADDVKDFEKYEDYVDPENLTLLFFDGEEKIKNEVNEKYNTLLKRFKPGEFSLHPVDENGNFAAKMWQVFIPVTDADFAKKIKEHDFKIAALANWPAIPEGYDLGIGDHINKLHHLSFPTKEASDSPQGKEPYNESKDGTYDFLLEKDKNYPGVMGMYSNWVKDGMKTDVAENFIRTEYGPGNSDSNKKFGELWWIWNFSAAVADNKTNGAKFFTFDNDTFKEDWAALNQKDLKEWLNASNASTPLKDIGPIKSNIGYFRFFSVPQIVDEEGNPVENRDFPNTAYKTTKTINSQSLTGIYLPKGDNTHNAICIQIPNNVELNIKWGSADGKEARIELDNRNHLDDNSAKSETIEDVSVSKKYNYDSTSQSYKEFKSKEIKITGDAEYLFIYSQNGNAIIYEIEMISSYYVHNIDNIGKTPKEVNIPMYGIQKFDKLGDLWEMGTVFDLSNFHEISPAPYPEEETAPGEEEPGMVVPYEYKSIPLLRSVAKVELKIPKSLGAHHVYLRCQNRKARCEPVDVSTPTDQLWDATSYTSVTTHGDECLDWEILMNHKLPFFDRWTTASNSEGQWNNYKSKLAWYYGSWADETGKVGGITPAKGNSAENEYPRIMNAMIERTDFTEFTLAGSDAMYDRYVLYVPDKYVDDPGSVGKSSKMETATPKVCHIEFRGAEDPYNNVDDNYCYRIYFTENGFAGGDPKLSTSFPNFDKVQDKDKDGNGIVDNNNKPVMIESTWENVYEQRPEILVKHWPILRNHQYSFTVTDPNSRIVVVKMEVLPWRLIEDNSYSW